MTRSATRRAWEFTVHLPCARVPGLGGPGAGLPVRAVRAVAELRCQPRPGLVPGLRPRDRRRHTRWSWLACGNCRSVEKALQKWLGIRVLPLGRHSILNGVALRVAEASSEDADAFAVAFEGLSLGWDTLFAWGDAEARRLADALVEAGTADVPLEVWQRTHLPSLAASIDAYERILRTPLPDALRERLLIPADGA